MKLLIITQKVDKNDSVLGFFHRWISEFSKHYDSVLVICLYKGEYSLPNNVKVLSLGKESGESKIKYVFNFYRYIWLMRNEYDKVFVHMNQEYVLLGGLILKILKKDIFMWRNHHAGSWLTNASVYFCKNVLCTSKYSYTAKFKSTVIMPVGVDLVNFKPNSNIDRPPQSILYLGRISPSKNIDIFIDALIDLKNNFPQLTGTICGDIDINNVEYYESLIRKVKKGGADSYISFVKGVPNTETVAIYSRHEVFVNLSSSGMYDKTIFEAIACGCITIASNDNLVGQLKDICIFEYRNKGMLVEKIREILNYSDDEKKQLVDSENGFIISHDLVSLSNKLFLLMK